MYIFTPNDKFTSGPFKYIKKETKKHGLLFEPELLGVSNDQDSPIGCPHIKDHFDYNTIKTFEDIFHSVKDRCSNILEIGVDHTNTVSSTSIILRNKNINSTYLGVDIHNKAYLDNKENNVHTLLANSANTELIYSKLSELNIKQKSIHFIYIDGWHSVNQVLAEWDYISDYLAPDGVAVFHDTNYHPGSRLIFDCIDENIFTTKKYFENEANWGLGEIRYK